MKKEMLCEVCHSVIKANKAAKLFEILDQDETERKKCLKCARNMLDSFQEIKNIT